MDLPLETVDNPKFTAFDSFIRNLLEEKKIPGTVFLAYRQGKIEFLQKYGWQDKENNIPISYSTIFRLYSMTKPITVIALLTLLEEGAFSLEDPISKYLPEFKDMMVFEKEENGQMITKKAKKEITILDLLTHTSGLCYGNYPTDPVEKLYQKVTDLEQKKSMQLKDIVSLLATMPLRFQPGDYFYYSYSIDVIARLIEILSNTPFNKFLNERVFQPLEMNDTSHHVPASKWDRFSKFYTYSAADGISEFNEPEIWKSYQDSNGIFYGGSGLSSTLKDYFNFAGMILNKGKFKGKQILQPQTIELMTTNHLPQNKTILEYAFTKEPWIERLPGCGLGFSIRVLIDTKKTQMGLGTNGWAGFGNSVYWIDPVNQVIGIFLAQVESFSMEPLLDHNTIWRLAYQGLNK
ncbi:MAG: serine hydrolase domain-containing protein [Candidatus Thorarchaeota archaeon]